MRSILISILKGAAAAVAVPSLAVAQPAPTAATSAGTADSAPDAAAGVEDTMAQRMQACTPCHGDQGRATHDGYYPRIAGKPSGYLFEQLLNFRAGRRTQPAMNHLLEHLSDDYLREIAAYFAALDLPYPAPVAATAPPGALQRGELLVTRGDRTRQLAACSDCHGKAMTGTLPATPGLLGLPRDYLAAQLGGWRNGTRRAAAPDCMAEVARRLTPDDVFAITSWLAARPVPREASAVPAGNRRAPLECGTGAGIQQAPAVAAVAAVPAATTGADGGEDERIGRGAYLALAGNCIGCHTTRGGVPYAGGRGIPTPFGMIYATNLTPDNETGLGRWTANDFYRALREGRSRTGRLLYPAFPYPNYSLVTREDSDVLFAFLRTLPPATNHNRPHALHFPFDSQFALAAWRMLFFRPSDYSPRSDRSPQWNRGEYLLRGLGHCDACHAARNLLGAVSVGADLGGGQIPGQNWYAPSLTSGAEAGVADWPVAEIVALLKTGLSGHGSAIGPMAEVVAGSTQYLTESDLLAMATVLKNQADAAGDGADGGAAAHRREARPSPERRPDTSKSARQAHERGATLYEEHCSGCHGADGRGVPGIYPPLAGNRAVTLQRPSNLVRIVADGGFPPATAGNPRPFGMPPFSQVLDDRAIADVLTFIRRSWGNQASSLVAKDIDRARR
jgi:cytochrome c553